MKQFQIPVSVTVSRKDGGTTIQWREGTEDEFFKAVLPLVRFGLKEMMNDSERKDKHDPEICD